MSTSVFLWHYYSQCNEQVTEGGWQDGQDGFMVTDSRKLRTYLEGKLLLDAELRSNFISSLEEAVQEEDLLHKALLPMGVKSMVGPDLTVLLQFGWQGDDFGTS